MKLLPSGTAEGIPQIPTLVLIGWAGNDVYGDYYGYRGCNWIHQARYNKTPADRKVAAEFAEKQHARVINAMDENHQDATSHDDP